MALVSVIKKNTNFINKLFTHCDVCGEKRADAHVIATFGNFYRVEKEHYYIHNKCAEVKLENPTEHQSRAQTYYNHGEKMNSDYLYFKAKAREFIGSSNPLMRLFR